MDGEGIGLAFTVYKQTNKHRQEKLCAQRNQMRPILGVLAAIPMCLNSLWDILSVIYLLRHECLVSLLHGSIN